jgi:signal transduction histidine kinase
VSTDADVMLRLARATDRSHVPGAVVRGDAHLVHHVNAALARFLGRTPQQLEGLTFQTLTQEPERAEALFGRALHSGALECATDLAYAGQADATLYGATLIRRVEETQELVSVVHIVDTTLITRNRPDLATTPRLLMLANEQLVLGSLRERELADVAAQASLEMERRLRRQSLLAEANALLSTSLSLADTLRAAAGLALPELAECCVVRLLASSASPRIAVAHVDLETERRLAGLHQELASDPELAVLEAGVLQKQSPFRIRLVSELPPVSSPVGRTVRHVLCELGAQSGLAVPLTARGAVIGVLFLVALSSRAFEPSDDEFALELGKRVSRALDNAQLFHEAKQASRMREDVLAIVSHDLRSPLNAVTMTVQHLLRTMKSGEPLATRKALELMGRSSEHMRRLIDELLEVANIQTGHLVLHCAPASLDDLVGCALELVQGSSSQKEVRLTCRSDPPGTWLTCDADKVVRVVINLLSNAIKFTPRGGAVELSTSLAEGEVRIAVSDNGPGIASEEQPKLFEQYWKGDQTGRIGMGLGLYIARGIVEAHGGRIWVKSELTRGSTFVFALPLAPQA